MSVLQSNAEIISRFIAEVWNGGRSDVIAAFVTPAFVDEAYQPPNALGHRDMVEKLKIVVPDARWQVERLVAEGSDVIAELVLSGTHGGEFAGIAPRGNPLQVRCFRRFTLEGGRISRHSALLDTHLLLRQMAAP